MNIPRTRILRILTIGLPIMGGMVSNVVLGLIDTAMVGYLGNAALGAVGLASFLGFIYLGVFFGVSIAVQALVSRRRGQGLDTACGEALGAALLLILLVAPPTSALLYFLIPSLFPLINDDPMVVETGVAYIRWIILQAPFVGFIQANTGFWNGIGHTRVYLGAMLAMHGLNVVFNYIFIFGAFGAPEMGAEGAGIATALASACGALLYLRLGLRHGRAYGYLRRRPQTAELGSVIRLSIPAALQQILDVAALTATYSIVGLVGTQELACYSVLINFINLVGLPAWGLGTAGATLVGQSLGEGETDAASRWAWDVIRIGVVGMAIIGIPFWLFPDLLLSFWLHDPGTRELAVQPTRILGIMIAFNGVGYMLAMMLNGAGDIRRVTWVNLLTQWLILVPGAWLVGIHLGYGLIGIWMVHQFLFRAGHVAVFGYFWRQGKWASIVV